MSDEDNEVSPSPRRRKQLTPHERVIAGAVGAAALVGGAAATFISTNSAGAGVMLAIGGLFGLVAITGNSVRAASFGGNRMEFDTDPLVSAAMAPNPESRAALAEEVIEGTVPASPPIREQAKEVIYQHAVVDALTTLGAQVIENYSVGGWRFDALVLYRGRRIAVAIRVTKGANPLVQAVLVAKTRLDTAPVDLAVDGLLFVVPTELPIEFIDSLHLGPQVRLVPWVGEATNDRLRNALQELAGVSG